MAWRCTGRTNAELISNLASKGIITSPRVRAAMTAVDRAHYLSASPSSPSLSAAYEDAPQPIGHGATISAPHMHAAAAEALLPYLHGDARVLDIGSGSGYLTHVLANIVRDGGVGLGEGKEGKEGKESQIPNTQSGGAGAGEAKGGKVFGIDHIQPLIDLANGNMSKSADGRAFLAASYLSSPKPTSSPSSSSSVSVSFLLADGRQGLPQHGPYDAIHVGAAAASLHPALLEQLKAPGRMFIPVEDEGGYGDQWIWVVTKDQDGKVKRERGVGVRYVPLTDRPGS